jgi:hypothetical protein
MRASQAKKSDSETGPFQVQWGSSFHVLFAARCVVERWKIKHKLPLVFKSRKLERLDGYGATFECPHLLWTSRQASLPEESFQRWTRTCGGGALAYLRQSTACTRSWAYELPFDCYWLILKRTWSRSGRVPFSELRAKCWVWMWLRRAYCGIRNYHNWSLYKYGSLQGHGYMLGIEPELPGVFISCCINWHRDFNNSPDTNLLGNLNGSCDSSSAFSTNPSSTQRFSFCVTNLFVNNQTTWLCDTNGGGSIKPACI